MFAVDALSCHYLNEINEESIHAPEVYVSNITLKPTLTYVSRSLQGISTRKIEIASKYCVVRLC